METLYVKCNNYIAMKKDGGTKEKGAFVLDPNLQQGINMPIVSRALFNYFINNKPIKDSITESTNILDFCVAKRTDEKFINEYHIINDSTKKVILLQKTLRFYMSTNGGCLFKKEESSDKIISYCIDSMVTILNDNIQQKIEDYNINYNYYIKECNKIINLIECKQLTLF